MDKHYQPSSEPDIYQLWLDKKVFTPKINKLSKAKSRVTEGKPFTIILPPPNANNPLHAGHALYTVEDIMIRYHRMLGDPTLWLPGTDHAGIETQFVFEKELQKTGQSRFDFDRDTLYKKIAEFVDKNKDISIRQLKRLGFSLDWTRLKFTLDPDHTARIYAVFQKMCHEGLIYRGERMVNYCTRCGTAFSNLEVNYVEEKTDLYYMKYGPFVLATTRPETKFGDTAVAVHPDDKRYQNLIGKDIIIDGLIGPFTVKVIADDMVDRKFGTGVVKITPAHDPNDFEAGLRHHLPIKQVIDFNGRLNHLTGKYQGLTVHSARIQIVKDLEAKGDLVKIDHNYVHRIGRCYRCNQVIEPMVSPQWFVKIKPLSDKAVSAVKTDKVAIFPKRFKKQFLAWMKENRDWNISRQIVWGHRIPAWYNLDADPQIFLTFLNQDKNIVTGFWQNLKDKYKFSEIKKGLQTLTAPASAKYYLSEKDALKTGPHILQETDTFDTWFSSGQWPYSTLGWDPDGHHSPDFNYFYPTSVLDTMWDILFFWVARMIMMGIYTTGQVPFKVAHMHSRVLDAKGQKMSKSKGNAINPTDIADKDGADALRLALVYGVAPGSDIALSDDKIRAQRHFVNKIWNASRFALMTLDRFPKASFDFPSKLHPDDQKIIKKLNKLITSVTSDIEKYRFGQASENLYQFFWHQFCDLYLESIKNRGADAIPVLMHLLVTQLKLLHPFAPFVTEAVYQQLPSIFTKKQPILATAPWPRPAHEKT